MGSETELDQIQNRTQLNEPIRPESLAYEAGQAFVRTGTRRPALCRVKSIPYIPPTSLSHLSEEPPIADAQPNLETRRDRSLQLALAAARTATDNNGQDVAVLDMRPITPEFDYFVIATGNSRRQLHAIGDEIDHMLEDELGDRRLGTEGYHESRWILLDYGSVVIHLFDEATRRFYALEDLWGTAERVALPWEQPSQGSV